ncbi:unnamed protein product, partial [Polarella glacialis]
MGKRGSKRGADTPASVPGRDLFDGPKDMARLDALFDDGFESHPGDDMDDDDMDNDDMDNMVEDFDPLNPLDPFGDCFPSGQGFRGRTLAHRIYLGAK